MIPDGVRISSRESEFRRWALPQHRDQRKVPTAATIAPPRILQPADVDWPQILDQIPDPPSRLYLSGQLPVASASLAIVGSRKATVAGRKTAFEIAAELTRAGFRVVSGLAYGIDAAALEGALHGGGAPLAILGNGLPDIYPAAHRHLAAKIIAAGGALVSEYRPGTPPRRRNFPRRNRLISGWSVAVILLEAATKSGSMGTARHALEQGREVLAFPGPITGGGNDGCHGLIQDGAALVTGTDDILAVLARQEPQCSFSQDARFLESLAREAGTDLERLQQRTGWSAVRLLRAWSHCQF